MKVTKANKIKKITALTLCFCFLAGVPVQAREIKAGHVFTEQADYSAVFDAEYYYNHYSDIREAVEKDEDKLLAHFLTSGMKEGRIAKADFDVRAYMKNNLDLIPVLGTKDLSSYYYHYIQSGQAEGRLAVAKDIVSDVNAIASYSTKYDSEEDRAVNVELAAERINGMVIQPGDSFSFSNTVGSRTVENGYVLAPSFASGRVVSSVGGGICQVSSTLYVAMLLSSIQPTERYKHSLAVDYVPEGLDSAIVEGVKDLKFRNAFSYPVTIKAAAKNGVLTVSICK